jgi:DNA-binding transcriptional LysR family regulator
MDQLTAMRVFIRIAEAGTFAKAADALNLAERLISIRRLDAH